MLLGCLSINGQMQMKSLCGVLTHHVKSTDRVRIISSDSSAAISSADIIAREIAPDAHRLVSREIDFRPPRFIVAGLIDCPLSDPEAPADVLITVANVRFISDLPYFLCREFHTNHSFVIGWLWDRDLGQIQFL